MNRGFGALAVGLAMLVFAFPAQGFDPCDDRRPGPAPSRDAAAQRMGAAVCAHPADFVAVAEATTPAVVNVSATRMVRRAAPEELPPFLDDPFLRRFFGEEFFRRFEGPPERRESSLGSGVIVSPEGYIVTNAHVIAGAEEIEVLLPDEQRYAARIVGSDPKSDIAVIRIDARGLPTVPWGDSDGLAVGQYVLAIGNPFGLNQTVTLGIVSAVGRANVGIAEYEDFIQTDAAINPGNSGGALVNVRGELVGINTAIVSRTGGHLGIGFAVPSNMVRPVIRSLIEYGRVPRGWLGVHIQAMTPALAEKFGVSEARGVLIAEVVPDSPAHRAGLRSGDVIVTFGGKAVRSPTELRHMVAEAAIDRKVEVGIKRDSRHMAVTAVPEEQPDQVVHRIDEDDDVLVLQPALAGVEVRTLTPEVASRLGLQREMTGVVVTRIESGAPAERAGLREADVIVALEHRAVRDAKHFADLSGEIEVHASVLLRIIRAGRTLFIVVEPR